MKLSFEYVFYKQYLQTVTKLFHSLLYSNLNQAAHEGFLHLHDV
jgi:hypothetical protein